MLMPHPRESNLTGPQWGSGIIFLKLSPGNCHVETGLRTTHLEEYKNGKANIGFLKKNEEQLPPLGTKQSSLYK